MGWMKDSISWAHFVSVLRESVDELKKSIGQHSAELQQLRQQNQMLLQQLVQQANEMQRLDRKLESVEAHLRMSPFHGLTIDGTGHQSRLPPTDPKPDDLQPGGAVDAAR